MRVEGRALGYLEVGINLEDSIRPTEGPAVGSLVEAGNKNDDMESRAWISNMEPY